MSAAQNVYELAIRRMFGGNGDAHDRAVWEAVVKGEAVPPLPLPAQLEQWGYPPATRRTWKNDTMGSA